MGGGGGKARFDAWYLIYWLKYHGIWQHALRGWSPEFQPELCAYWAVWIWASPFSWGPNVLICTVRTKWFLRALQLWIPDIAFSIVFLISSSCPPGPRPPVKRQDTGLSPNPSFSWSSASYQEVGKQDFLWGCFLWSKQFPFGERRGDREHHPGLQTLKPISVGLMFSSTLAFELLKVRECINSELEKEMLVPLWTDIITQHFGGENGILFLFKVLNN